VTPNRCPEGLAIASRLPWGLQATGECAQKLELTVLKNQEGSYRGSHGQLYLQWATHPVDSCDDGRGGDSGIIWKGDGFCPLEPTAPKTDSYLAFHIRGITPSRCTA